MKRKKVVFLIIIMLLLFPFTIHAEECKKTDIKIEKVELSEIRGNAEETSTASNDHNQIHLNTKMNVLGDSITYKAVIKNVSNSDYVFDKNQITKDYINYDITYEDDSNIVKAGEEKTIYLRLNYHEKPQVENLSNGVFTSNNLVSFNLTKENTIENPVTGNKIMIYLSVILISILMVRFLSKRQKSVLLMILLLCIIPQMVQAVCTSTLDINLNLEIDAKEAIFLPGIEANVKIKQLDGNDTATLGTKNYTITSIKQSEIEPTAENKETKNILSTVDSGYPIYMWFDNGTIYWWSEDKTPSLNENASYMLVYLYELSDISGLESFDTYQTTTLEAFFLRDKIETVDSLKNWNTENVKSLYALFFRDFNLKDVSGIKNWNVEAVENLSDTFASCYELESIDLSNWNTKSVTKMFSTFGMWKENGTASTDGKLKRIILSEKFDTSKVTTTQGLFANDDEIEDYEFLKYINAPNNTITYTMFQNNYNFTTSDLKYLENWDMSHVTNVSYMFFGDKKIESLEMLRNWDTSSITEFQYMFMLNESLKNLNGLENWDVSNATNMTSMFQNVTSLEDASSINDWNISNTTNFEMMFKGTPTHPEFSKIQGTWSDGTFTPTP